MNDQTNEEIIEAALKKRAEAYRRGAPGGSGPLDSDLHAAQVLDHFRVTVVQPMADKIRAYRAAEQAER